MAFEVKRDDGCTSYFCVALSQIFMFSLPKYYFAPVVHPPLSTTKEFGFVFRVLQAHSFQMTKGVRER